MRGGETETGETGGQPAWIQQLGESPIPLGRTCVIGSDPEASIVVNSPRVAPWHAAVYRCSPREFGVMALDVVHPVRLNSKRVHLPLRLKHRDRLSLGPTEFAYQTLAGESTLPETDSEPEDWDALVATVESASEDKEWIQIVVDDNGIIEALPSEVRNAFTRFFPRFDPPRLPLEVVHWMKEAQLGLKQPFSRTHRNGDRVIVRIIRGSDPGRQMLEVRADRVLSSLAEVVREHHLTLGEAEALFYLACNLSENEIFEKMRISRDRLDITLRIGLAKLRNTKPADPLSVVRKYFR